MIRTFTVTPVANSRVHDRSVQDKVRMLKARLCGHHSRYDCVRSLCRAILCAWSPAVVAEPRGWRRPRSRDAALAKTCLEQGTSRALYGFIRMAGAYSQYSFCR